VLQLPSVKAASSLQSSVKTLLQTLAETNSEAEAEPSPLELVDPPVPAYSYTLKSWQGRPSDLETNSLPVNAKPEEVESEEEESDGAEPNLPSDNSIAQADPLPELACPDPSDGAANQPGVEGFLPAAVEASAGGTEADVTPLPEPIFIADLAEARNGNSAGSRLSPGLRRLKAKLQPAPSQKSELPPVE